MTDSTPMTVENFIRAETDLIWCRGHKGGFGQFEHNRKAMAIDAQTVVRLNRDTLYSGAVLDLDAGPATVTLPDPGRRFLSLQVYRRRRIHPADRLRRRNPHVHQGTDRHPLRIARHPDPGQPRRSGRRCRSNRAAGRHHPRPSRHRPVRAAPLGPGQPGAGAGGVAGPGLTLPDMKHMFGQPGEVDPVRRLIGAAMGWGGNPYTEAIYLNVTPSRNDGNTVYRLTVKYVPVDGFWSVIVYNADGYIPPMTATPTR